MTFRSSHRDDHQPEADDRRRRDAGVAIGRPLYGDSLGAPGTPAGTYIGMMRENIDAIVAGLITSPAP